MFLNKDSVLDIILDDSNILNVYDIDLILEYLQSSLNLPLLEKILINTGYSINSASLYKMYIFKLQDTEKIRNTFLHILQVPMHNLPDFYSEYEEFEMEVNKSQAKKILSETFLVYHNTLSIYNQIKKGNNIFDLLSLLKLSEDELFKRVCFVYREALYFHPYSEEVYFSYSEYLIKNGKREEAEEIVRLGMENISGVFLRVYYLNRVCINITNNKDYLGDIEKDNTDITNISNVNVNAGCDTLHYSQILIMNHLSTLLKKEGLTSFRKEFVKYKIKNMLNDVIYKTVADYEYKYTTDKDIVIRIYTSGIEDTGSKYLKESLIDFLLSTGDYHNCLLYSKKYKVGYSKILEYEYKYGTEYYNMINIIKDEVKDSKKENITGEFLNTDSVYTITKKNMSFGMNINLREDVTKFIESINYIKKGDNVLKGCNIETLMEIMRKI